MGRGARRARAGRALPLGLRGRQQPVALTAREFDLLAFLMRHPGEVFLLDRVWGYTFEETSMVTVHVRRLRRKIEPGNAMFISPHALRTPLNGCRFIVNLSAHA